MNFNYLRFYLYHFAILFSVLLICSCGVTKDNKGQVMDISSLVLRSVKQNKPIKLKAGTYYLKNFKQNLTGNLILIGEGPGKVVIDGMGTSILLWNNTKVDTIICENIIFKNFDRVINVVGDLPIEYVRFKNNEVQHANFGFFLRRHIKKALVENNSFSNLGSEDFKSAIAVFLGKKPASVKRGYVKSGQIHVINNQFENIIGGLPDGGGQIHAILIRGKEVLVADNKITNLFNRYNVKTTGTDAIYCSGDSILIENNELHNAHGFPACITIKGREGKHATKIKSNKIIIDDGKDIPSRGIYGGRKNVIVQKNHFEGLRRGCIGTSASDWLIEDNVFKNTRTSCDIAVFRKNFTIRNNQFINPLGRKGRQWVSIFVKNNTEDVISNVVIENNTFKVFKKNEIPDNSAFIKVYYKTKMGKIEDVKIANNSFINEKKGINLNIFDVNGKKNKRLKIEKNQRKGMIRSAISNE